MRSPPSPSNRHRWLWGGIALLLVIGAFSVLAQGRGRGSRMARQDHEAFPTWELPAFLPKDVFTFVRIEYSGFGGGWGRGDWTTDAPDADLNFAYRLQQMTSMTVCPHPTYIRLTDPRLFHYPFIYMVEVGGMYLEEEELPILRRYLLNGGFLMVDDFWGEEEYLNLHEQLQRLFPGREPIELPLEHPIFHTVFDLRERPQIPNVWTGTRSQFTGVTWERSDAIEVHYKGLFDDKGRLMVMICHNTDLGDGWEREGENIFYFREFSEKKAYPLGINIIVYAMTH